MNFNYTSADITTFKVLLQQKWTRHTDV